MDLSREIKAANSNKEKSEILLNVFYKNKYDNLNITSNFVENLLDSLMIRKNIYEILEEIQGYDESGHDINGIVLSSILSNISHSYFLEHKNEFLVNDNVPVMMIKNEKIRNDFIDGYIINDYICLESNVILSLKSEKNKKEEYLNIIKKTIEYLEENYKNHLENDCKIIKAAFYINIDSSLNEEEKIRDYVQWIIGKINKYDANDINLMFHEYHDIVYNLNFINPKMLNCILEYYIEKNNAMLINSLSEKLIKKEITLEGHGIRIMDGDVYFSKNKEIVLMKKSDIEKELIKMNLTEETLTNTIKNRL